MAAIDTTLQRTHPALCEYLTSMVCDGKSRFTATLLVFAENGRFKACLSDRETDCSFFRSSESFQGLLDAVEASLRQGDADWRPKSQRKK